MRIAHGIIDARRILGSLVLALLFASALAPCAKAADTATKNDAPSLADELRPLWSCLSGERAAFTLSAQARVEIDRKTHQIDARLVRYDDQAFDLELKHADYPVQLRRRGDVTAFALPLHKVVFIGRGEVDQADQLSPKDISRRLVGPGSLAAVYVPLLQGDPSTAALALTALLKAAYDPAAKQWTVGKSAKFRFDKKGSIVDLTIDKTQVHIEVGAAGDIAAAGAAVAGADSKTPSPLGGEGRGEGRSAAKLPLSQPLPTGERGSTPPAADDWPGLKVVKLERRELERQFARGIRRALEVAAPSPLLTSPAKTAAKVEHGELRWIDGQRVVLLHGTPEQIGRAHGRLLKTEAFRCIDSVLYAFGTIQTVRTGRWFRHDLEAAYARLSPHIPDDHKRETRALAESLDSDPALAAAVNVFPELFHCSGFAVFGKATKDGKLYHGRVLDYMTTIGLQDSATTFIVAVDGKIPFANVGYAGFTGSVSGMNARAISLGEMGGRGEGRWDGAPMATLMRRALEECSTLDQVMDLWKRSPRTCEYYYVFADGKTNQAVGVAATPESIEFPTGPVPVAK